jgi:hypothetical protein
MLAKINNKVSLSSFYVKTVKRRYIYLLIEDSEDVLCFERKNAGLIKLSQVLFGQKSDSSAYLNAIYVLNCEQHFSYFDPN